MFKYIVRSTATILFGNWFCLIAVILAFAFATSVRLLHQFHENRPHNLFAQPEDSLTLSYSSWFSDAAFDFSFFFLPPLIIALITTCIWRLFTFVVRQSQVSPLIKNIALGWLATYLTLVTFSSWLSLTLFWDDLPSNQGSFEANHTAANCWLNALPVHILAPLFVPAVPLILGGFLFFALRTVRRFLVGKQIKGK
ncbi:MAG: hypothetical protein K2X29_03080 [Candidatus Obscuribacterales bacterium]|nr:hypothetical protein [Candidatus Obscuribacterales bacterium]